MPWGHRKYRRLVSSKQQLNRYQDLREPCWLKHFLLFGLQVSLAVLSFLHSANLESLISVKQHWRWTPNSLWLWGGQLRVWTFRQLKWVKWEALCILHFAAPANSILKLHCMAQLLNQLSQKWLFKCIARRNLDSKASHVFHYCKNT